MSIMIKIAKFEYLSEKLIIKLFQKKEIFIEVEKGMSLMATIYYYYVLVQSYEDFRWFPFY